MFRGRHRNTGRHLAMRCHSSIEQCSNRGECKGVDCCHEVYRRKMSSGFSNIKVTTNVARSAWVETWEWNPGCSVSKSEWE